jgi:hypothetical protein
MKLPGVSDPLPPISSKALKDEIALDQLRPAVEQQREIRHFVAIGVRLDQRLGGANRLRWCRSCKVVWSLPFTA